MLGARPSDLNLEIAVWKNRGLICSGDHRVSFAYFNFMTFQEHPYHRDMQGNTERNAATPRATAHATRRRKVTWPCSSRMRYAVVHP